MSMDKPIFHGLLHTGKPDLEALYRVGYIPMVTRAVVAIGLAVMSGAGVSSATAAGSEPYEIFYARPVTECPINGNGRAYTCATAHGQVGAWSRLASPSGTASPEIDIIGTIDGGDTLKLCGNFTYSSRAYNGQMMSPGKPFRGVAGRPVTITGDCQDEGRSDEGIIDGEMLESRGVDIRGDYVTLRDLTIKNLKDTGISSHFGQEVAGTQILHVKISHIGAAPGTSRTCIELNSSSAVIEHVDLADCGGDGIFIGNGSTGQHHTIVRDVTMRGISSQLNSGDGIQMEPGGGSLTLQRVTVSKHGTDKACFLVGGVHGSFHIDDVECTAEPGAGPFGGITIEGAQTGSYIHGAYIHDIPGGTGIYLRASTAAHTGTLDITGSVLSNLQTNLLLGGEHPLANIRFHQNTISGGTGYGIWATSTWNPGLFSVRNNIIQSAGYNLLIDGTPLRAACDWDSDYNLWSGTGTFLFLGTNYATLAEYVAVSGNDTSSKYADPGFLGPDDARLSCTSRARRAGGWWGAECRDFRGFSCRLPPDIGAHQFNIQDFAD